MSRNSNFGIFDVLDNKLTSGQFSDQKVDMVKNIRDLEAKHALNDFSHMDDLKDDYPEDYKLALSISEMMRNEEKSDWEFNNKYKKSIKELIRVHGLPVHIDGFDIHDHNIDIDAVPNIREIFEKGGSFEIGQLFQDSSEAVFATSPYPLVFLQLETNETYRKGLGAIVSASNTLNTSRLADLKKAGATEEMLERAVNYNNQTYCLIQSYHIDDYIEYLHLFNDGSIGSMFKDTARTIFDSEQIKDSYGDQLDEDFCTFIQIYDFINVYETDWYVEEQVVTFLNKHGQSTMQKRLNYHEKNSGENNEVSANTNFYLSSAEKVFQWWNSDNDLLEQADVPTKKSWTKGVKKLTKKSNRKKAYNLTYKTLKVRPTVKVVDSNGVERTPRLKEIAQHTRRGHWAHYGINGKGLLFGKYEGSYYRKPKTIGKLSNGLVIKDYTLEMENEDE